ncbi:glycerate kinase [Chitinophaga silvatica]|uniref:Glycerate kinase n=1 Tax=Chitinophaga silvatica TaxID=2282649 RepID=A0A3E1Y8T2_9BACT|nr:glycerate kinase [Chitinophaga silvatica]RFS21379.1 glycerate kinase [Chitinophaga silvatica]
MNTDIENIFLAAVAAVHPEQLMQSNIIISGANTLLIAGISYTIPTDGKIWIFGAGKASAAMAREAEQILSPYFRLQGCIVTKYGHGMPLQNLELIEAGHPIPDSNSIAATVRILELSKLVAANDLVLFLLSGGASSLLADVHEGTTLSDIQTVFEALLKSGADIYEMNIVRKHLSAIKGGQLARLLAPARVCSLILSDVVGDDLSIIGSGPTVADPSTFQDCMTILEKYQLINKIPQVILQHIKEGVQGNIAETLKPGSKELSFTSNYLIGSNAIALSAAEKTAKELGYYSCQLSSTVTGNVDTVAKWLVNSALEYKGTLPACLLAGGETTVVVTGSGKGGRNQQFALTAARLIENYPQITILSAGTDGNDGPTEAAGAIVNASTIKKAKDLQLNPLVFLANNDAWTFFSKVGGLIITGPTNTNVMDIMVVLIRESEA